MRICYVAEAGSIHTQKWVKYFANHGHTVHLISMSGWTRDLPNDIHLHLLRKRIARLPFNLPFILYQVRKLIGEIQPDILHSHFVAGQGFWGAVSGKHPFVLTAWGSDILVAPKESQATKWMVQYALKKADLLTCDAVHMVTSMIQMGAPASRVRVINFGIDTDRFNGQCRNPRLKEQWGRTAETPVVISTRSLTPIYDVGSLVRAVPLIRVQFPDVRVLIVGDGAQRAELEKLAGEVGAADAVLFLGRVPNDDLPRYLASADVYVSTALSDGGIASSTAEAMACELPVVITDFGDNRQWVSEGRGGFLIPAKDPQAVADRVAALLKSKELRKQFGLFNRQVIVERDSYTGEMGKMDTLYRDLAEGRQI